MSYGRPESHRAISPVYSRKANKSNTTHTRGQRKRKAARRKERESGGDGEGGGKEEVIQLAEQQPLLRGRSYSGIWFIRAAREDGVLRGKSKDIGRTASLRAPYTRVKTPVALNFRTEAQAVREYKRNTSRGLRADLPPGPALQRLFTVHKLNQATIDAQEGTAVSGAGRAGDLGSFQSMSRSPLVAGSRGPSGPSGPSGGAAEN